MKPRHYRLRRVTRWGFERRAWECERGDSIAVAQEIVASERERTLVIFEKTDG
jgi:hypothetical protein